MGYINPFEIGKVGESWIGRPGSHFVPALLMLMQSCLPASLHSVTVSVQPIESGAVSKVLASDSADFQAGDIVTGGLAHWATHQLVKSGQDGVDDLVKIDPKAGLPLSYYTGILGGFCRSQTDVIHADARMAATTACQRGLR